jgi:hypothetical protein
MAVTVIALKFATSDLDDLPARIPGRGRSNFTTPGGLDPAERVGSDRQ